MGLHKGAGTGHGGAEGTSRWSRTPLGPLRAPCHAWGEHYRAGSRGKPHSCHEMGLGLHLPWVLPSLPALPCTSHPQSQAGLRLGPDVFHGQLHQELIRSHWTVAWDSVRPLLAPPPCPRAPKDVSVRTCICSKGISKLKDSLK